MAVVVSLGKLAAGHEDYYEREVAGGAEDYYAMRGEAAGEWTGGGAQALGLEGTASAAVSCGRCSRGATRATGEVLRSRMVHVTGWDVTYSPPDEPVSVLHAAGDPRIAGETLAGHRVAVGDRRLATWSPRRVEPSRSLVARRGWWGRGSSAPSTCIGSAGPGMRSCIRM